MMWLDLYGVWSEMTGLPKGYFVIVYCDVSLSIVSGKKCLRIKVVLQEQINMLMAYIRWLQTW